MRTGNSTKLNVMLQAHRNLSDESNCSLVIRSKMHKNICEQVLSSPMCHHTRFNPLKGTLKPQSNGPLYSNTVIATLAVDGWAVTFGTADVTAQWLVYQLRIIRCGTTITSAL